MVHARDCPGILARRGDGTTAGRAGIIPRRDGNDKPGERMRGIRGAVSIMLFAALAAMVMAAGSAHADYPDRQITMIVCFPAGGGTDIAARLVNVSLGEALGKPVIIENRGGAGGSIGTAAAARAAPDGYTLLVCSSAFVVNPSL